MDANSHVTTIDRMTTAVFENDSETLTEIFTDDMTFHVRGALPRAGDHTGVDGFLGFMGELFELTEGDIKIEQLSILSEGEWATEWEHAVLGRGGRTLDTRNVFVYRFDGDRIAELWMINAALPGAESFWE